MRRVFHIGRLGSLEIRARASVLPVFLLLWTGLFVVGLLVLRLAPASALLGGLAASLLHYLSDLWHQLSHSFAARRTGHPMTGVQFWGPLSTSLYPEDEPRLPAAVHLRRAIGGPLGSLALAAAAGVLALALRPVGGVWMWLSAFFFLDNLLTFTLGALLPLGFTDGSTLLYWMRRGGA